MLNGLGADTANSLSLLRDEPCVFAAVILLLAATIGAATADPSELLRL